MGKTGFHLLMALVLLLPTTGATLYSDSPNNLTTDQLALLDLKSHITHDPENLLKTNWSTAASVCNWIGVSCGSRNHRVTALNLSGMDLTGTIRPHFGNLSFLESLDIQNNRFYGSLPVELANLRQLKLLKFGNNSFSGEIPSSLGNLSKLEMLSLYDNDLRGHIPTAFGNLSNLEYLSLRDNQLSGNLPSEIFKCKQIEYLQFHRNQLEGTIPLEVGSATSLIFFDIYGNNFSGWIPAMPHQLLFIALSENKLNGEIPLSICNMSSIEVVDLSQNNLAGNVPECFGNLSLSLLHLNLYMNKFYGEISETFFPKSCVLRGLRINDNQLEGPIPRSIANCKDLQILDLGSNMFYDTFPIWLGNLKNLQILFLRSNRFYGHIANPEVPSSFSRLRIIDLSNNNFSGYLPSMFFENLNAIINGVEKKVKPEYMGGETLAGLVAPYNEELIYVIMKGLKAMVVKISTSLTIIDFSNNQFNEWIPEILGKLGSLIVLNLSHNSLTGPIPLSLSNLSELESLDLSSNKLQGRIPAELANLNFLAVLELSWNNLTGLIPRGKQFDTFTNDTYSGNMDLCGFPLSKDCDNNWYLEPPPSKDDVDDRRTELNWKFSILMGYGCGLVFGLSMGYILFTTGKPFWFIQIIERVQHKYIGSKIRRKRGRK